VPAKSLILTLELAEERNVWKTVSERIVLGFGCCVAVGRKFGPGFWDLGMALKGRVFSLFYFFLSPPQY
jgi:hypothetical protein